MGKAAKAHRAKVQKRNQRVASWIFRSINDARKAF